jgi:preprotein translocase subunit SecY
MLLLGFFLPSSHNFNQFLKKTKLVNKIFLALLLFLFSVFYCYLKKEK